jgi:hypothetical protein
MTMIAQGNGAVRRAMLLLAAAVIAAVMVVATAAQALAVRGVDSGAVFACNDGTLPEAVIVAGSDKQDLVKQGYTCTKLGKRR